MRFAPVILSLGAVGLLLAAGGAGESTPLTPPNPPPPLPAQLASPVDSFRKLLAMSPGERLAALAVRPEKQREYLRARLGEFDALTPREREVRLRVLELRCVLVPLLRSAPANRVHLLPLVPPAYRELVQTQLKAWDALPPDRQKQMLARESDWVLLPPLPPEPTGARAAARALAAEQRRRELATRVAALPPLPPTQREHVFEQIERLFALDERQRGAVLAALPEPQRRSLELMLAAFGRLGSEERARCVEAFLRFAAMRGEERAQFLRNAARWEAMAPVEQQAWRALLARVPPAPPGMAAAAASRVPPAPPAP